MIHKPVHKQAAGPGCGRLVYDALCTQQGSDEMIQSCLPSSDYINLLFYTFNFPGGDTFGLFSSIRTSAWLFSCTTWLRWKHSDLAGVCTVFSEVHVRMEKTINCVLGLKKEKSGSKGRDMPLGRTVNPVHILICFPFDKRLFSH